MQRPTSWRGCEARVHIKFCVWQGVKTHVIKRPPVYFHRADWKTGDGVPARSVAGNAVVGFDYLSVGENGPRGAQSLSEDAGLRYILAIMKDLINVCL